LKVINETEKDKFVVLKDNQLADTEAKEARKLLKKFKKKHPGKITIK
jgi:hypothetical protein